MNSLERCKELIKEKHSNWIGLSNQEAIKEIIEKFENSIPKSKIQEKLKELEKKEEELSDGQGYWGNTELIIKIDVLKELLESEENK